MLTSQERELSKSGAAAMNDPALSVKLFDVAKKRVFVAGHRGMVGSAIVRRLRREQCEVLIADRNEVDLLRQGTTERLLADLRPHVIVVAAGKVGGIHANETFPAEFIYENLAIATNVIHGAYLTKVNKLLFLGSSCIYPQLAPQPISEEALLTGPLESTNEWYAIAKIAGLKLCQAYRRQYGADFVCVMPTNLFGPGDNYHPEHGHVIAALMRRFHEAKMSAAPAVRVWGTGSARRDFMHVDDLADACITVLERYSAESPLNIGTGKDITIAELARLLAEIVDYRGELLFDASKPDGTPRKLLDISKLDAIGWHAETPLRVGLESTYADFIARR